MTENEKVTITTLYEKARQGQRISMLSLYDYPFAVLAQEAGVDSIVVGEFRSDECLWLLRYASSRYGYDGSPHSGGSTGRARCLFDR